MKIDFSANEMVNSRFQDKRKTRFFLKFFLFPALLVAAVIGFSGCAEDGYYASGYGRSYYAPDYGSYYGDYGYAGDPYWGAGPYSGGEIIIGGHHHHGYYGGHHFAHQGSGGSRAGFRGGSRGAGSSAVHAAPAHGGGGGRRP
jgi:hypothetical protein